MLSSTNELGDTPRAIQTAAAWVITMALLALVLIAIIKAAIWIVTL